MLGFVGIRHKAHVQHSGSAGHVGETLGNQPAGARFRGGYRQAPLGQQLHHGVFQAALRRAVRIDRVDIRAQPLTQPVRDGAALLLRFLLRGRFRRDPEKHLAVLGVRSHGGIRKIQKILRPLRRRTFPDPEGAHHERRNHAAAQPVQIRHQAVADHRLALGRRAGQQRHQTAVLRAEHTARRGAVIVREHVAALGEHGLLPLGFTADAAPEMLLNPAAALLVHHQLLSADARRDLLGEIVLRRPQSADQHHQIAARQRQTQRFLQTRGIIPHGEAAQHVDPGSRQLTGGIRRIGIDRVAEQQLSPHGNQFSLQDSSFLSVPGLRPRPGQSSSHGGHPHMIAPALPHRARFRPRARRPAPAWCAGGAA